MSAPSSAARDPLIPQFQNALEFAGHQARRIVAKYPGYTPMYTVGGRWNREGERWTHWCEGFFPGILWLLHKDTADPAWRILAEQYTRALAPRRFDRQVHDLGFLFFSTYLRWYHLTGDVAHEGIFDLESGAFLRTSTHQGWSADSTWARGLAWALYGFTAVYRLSGEPEFLDTARRCADYFIQHAPPGLVPLWDFDVPAD